MARFARWVSVAAGVLALIGGATPAPVAAPAATGTDLAGDARATRRTRLPAAARPLTNTPRPCRAAWSASPGPAMVNRGYAAGADADTGMPAAADRFGRPPAGEPGGNPRYRPDLPGRKTWPNG